jgi:hypothetical protein
MIMQECKNCQTRNLTDICKKLENFCEENDITIGDNNIRGYWDGGKYTVTCEGRLKYISSVNLIK